MGFSVLSIVEIIYFLSLRPYYKQRLTQKEKTHKKTIERKKDTKKVLDVTNLSHKMNSRLRIGPKIAWMKYDTSGVDENYVPFPYTE